MEAEFTTREQMDAIQRERLPSLATRITLHPRPHQALQDATMQDATELAAADVVESGREFAHLTDAERQQIYTRNYAYCLARNTQFLHGLETKN